MKAQPVARIEPREPQQRTGDSQVTERIAAASPRTRARITGVVYLLFFVTAVLGEFFTRQAGISGIQPGVSGDAAATANTILTHELLYRLGFALGLISTACYIAVTALFHQLQALALMFLNLNAQVGYIALVFDGLFLFLIGYLIFRSTFLPRILGALVAFAGLGWLTFLSPPLANYLYTYIQVLGVLAEGSLMLWLLAIGVNAQRWIERASAAVAYIHP